MRLVRSHSAEVFLAYDLPIVHDKERVCVHPARKLNGDEAIPRITLESLRDNIRLGEKLSGSECHVE